MKHRSERKGINTYCQPHFQNVEDNATNDKTTATSATECSTAASACKGKQGCLSNCTTIPHQRIKQYQAPSHWESSVVLDL
jgi:hypothetical protein